MADPTIQTFCCHRSHLYPDTATRIMDQFNTTSYNVLCLISSMIGIVGATIQILPTEERTVHNNRVRTVPMTRGRKIILWLAFADLMASLGVFVRSIVWIQYKNVMTPINIDSDVLFCVLTSAWIQYFYMATWFWTMCYAIEAYSIIKNKTTYLSTYHMLAWGLPALFTSTGLSILYIPDANCNDLQSLNEALIRILPNYCMTYVAIAMVMVVNPIIYIISAKDLEILVALPHAQLTSRERHVSGSLKIKFAMINVVFYMCWLPNIINGVLLWTLWFNLPVKIIVVVWYIMAFMNPLQAFLNALVYRRWHPSGQSLRMPFYCECFQNKNNDPSPFTPLLHEPKRPSRLVLNKSSQHTINASSSM